MRYSELDVLPNKPTTDSAPLITELIAEGFDFPTSVAFSDNGTPFVAESGLPFGGARPGGRIVQSKRAADVLSSSTICARR